MRVDQVYRGQTSGDTLERGIIFHPMGWGPREKRRDAGLGAN